MQRREQRRKNAEMQKFRNANTESRNRKMENRENTVYKTQDLKNLKQIVIILKTFTYFINFIVPCRYLICIDIYVHIE